MVMVKSLEIRRPRNDDRLLWDTFFALEGSIAVFAAHKLGLFELLGKQPRGLPELCDALKLAPRPAEALLSISAAAGFVELDQGRYQLTPVAEDYLLESSPPYFDSHWRNLVASLEPLHTISSVLKAAQTDSQQVYGGGDWTKSARRTSRARSCLY
jgi:Dimerisation domain